MTSRVTVARSEQEISACYPVMAELRSHIRPGEFLSTVRRLAKLNGFRLA